MVILENSSSSIHNQVSGILYCGSKKNLSKVFDPEIGKIFEEIQFFQDNMFYSVMLDSKMCGSYPHVNSPCLRKPAKVHAKFKSENEHVLLMQRKHSLAPIF